MRFLLILLMLTFVAGPKWGQQINHPNASQLNYSGNSTPSGWNVAPQWIPGPFTVTLAPDQPGNLVTMTQGLQGMYFETYVASGPPKTGIEAYVMPNGDVMHLDLAAFWSLDPMYNGITPCNQLSCPTSYPTGPWGALATSWPYGADASFNFTVQSWVTDPGTSTGYRLTAAVHVVK
jgi:hypothetical protein